MNLLPPVFQKLIEEFPLLRPTVKLVPFPSLFGLIENRTIHAAFGIKEGQKKSSLYFRELCSAPIACVCPPKHPLAQYSVLEKSQLSGNIVACSPRQIPHSVFAIQHTQVAALPATRRYFTESLESAFVLVKAGIGYTICPDIPGMREPDLCYIPIRNLPELPFGVFYRYDNDHPVLKRFLSLLAAP